MYTLGPGGLRSGTGGTCEEGGEGWGGPSCDAKLQPTLVSQHSGFRLKNPAIVF